MADPKPPSTTSTSAFKPFHSIILDSTPLLLNTPSLSTLLADSSALVTTQSVISEIRDAEARSRVETLYQPFLTIKAPKTESVTLVKAFARKTGDSGVLSNVDLEILALAYDLECEKNGGDWRLRREPGQKRLNGSPPQKEKSNEEATEEVDRSAAAVTGRLESVQLDEAVGEKVSNDTQTVSDDTGSYTEPTLEASENAPHTSEETVEAETETSSGDDSDGWITPSNIKKHQAKDEGNSTSKSDVKTLQVATITGDFAMQNVLLQMNLNLLSPATCERITKIKQTILRCHGCFATTKEMTKQFCPRCGNPTLTRVTCTTNDKGDVKLHLKANMQWNNKGNVFSVPKPVAGSSNQKWKGPRQGGGQGGWGSGLILAEDQKEYSRAAATNRRSTAKDLMDEDYLPRILTGDRDRGSGKIRIGGGRNINAKKR